MKGAEKTLFGVMLLGGIGLAVVLGVVLGGGDHGGGNEPAGIPETETTDLKGADQTAPEIDRPADGVTQAEPSRVLVQPEGDGLAVETEPGVAAKPAAVGKLSGRIVSEFGEPLDGAQVRFAVNPLGSMLRAVRFSGPGGKAFDLAGGGHTCEAGEDGRFLLEKLPAQEHAQLVIQHTRFVIRYYHLENYDGGEQDLGDIALTLGGSISGYVVDESGAAVADAEVFARPVQPPTGNGIRIFPMPGEKNSFPHKTVTGKDGFYRIQGLPQGRTHLFADHPDHVGTPVKNQEIVKGRETSRINITLEAGQTLSGHVVDEEGDPVPGARVRVDTTFHFDLSEVSAVLPGMAKSPTAESGDDGYFLLKGLEEGKYTLRVLGKTYLPFSEEHVKAGRSDLVVVLRKGGWVAGRVRNARTMEAVEAFDIRVEDPGRLNRMTPIILKGAEAGPRMPDGGGPQGAFYIEGLPEGNVGLIVSAEGYAEETLSHLTAGSGSGQVIDVALWAESVVAGCLVAPDGKTASEGTVYLRKPRDRSTGRPGMQRREIRVERDGDVLRKLAEKWEKSAKSDEDGSFIIRGVPEGDYEITASHEEHTDAVAVAMTVARGERVEDLVVRLGESGSIEGTVFGVDGVPKRGARVQARSLKSGDLSWEAEATADKDGLYRLKGLAPGHYMVKLATSESLQSLGGVMVFNLANLADETAPGIHRVAVKAGVVTKLDLQETMKASVSGRVMEAGKPAPDMAVKLFKSGRYMFMPLRTEKTDAEGAYRFEELEPGSYTLKVALVGQHDSLEEEVDLSEGAMIQQDFNLPSGRITGQIRDQDNGLPIPKIIVALERYVEEEEEEQEEEQQVTMSFGIMAASSDGDGTVQSFSFTSGAGQPVVTDEEGRYEIRFVRDGKYTIKASGEGYVEGVKEPVIVAEGKETSLQNLHLKPGYGIAGKVIHAHTGEPLPFTTILYNGFDEKTGVPGNPEFAMTGDQGAFKITGLNPGKYSLKLDGEDYSGSLEVLVAKDDVKDVELIAQPNN